MSADLHDLKRLKVSAETRAWLTAEAHRTGRSQHEIARDALHELALEKIHAAKVLLSLSPSEGRTGDGRAHAGDGRGRGGKR